MKKLLANIIIFLLFLTSTESICLALSDTNNINEPKEKEGTFIHMENENLSKSASIQMKIMADKKKYSYPEPVTIQLFLFKPYPVSGAKVYAQMTSPSGKIFDIPFSENILVGSTPPSSGSYVTIITDLEEDGRYLVNIQANDNDGQAYFATPFGDEASETNKFDTQRPKSVEPFEISKIVSIQVSGYEGAGDLPPLKVTTLWASVESNHRLRLSWQTPINIGPRGLFEIRYAKLCQKLRNAWVEAQLLFRGEYIRKGGEAQEYKTGVLGEGKYCFAVISENRNGLKSEISNQYIVILK